MAKVKVIHVNTSGDKLISARVKIVNGLLNTDIIDISGKVLGVLAQKYIEKARIREDDIEYLKRNKK